jgi:hypothetical protein
MLISSQALEITSSKRSTKEGSTTSSDERRRNKLRNGINLKFKTIMKYIVYQTVNKINNKIYIGVHGTEIDEFDGYIGNGVSIYRPATYMHPKTPF